MDAAWSAQLPSAVSLDELLTSALPHTDGQACCVFAADGVDLAARRGYAALVLAYARRDEPVAVLEDGAAVLLVRDGGVPAASVVARRVLAQAARVGLDAELQVGLAPLGTDPAGGLRSARAAARRAGPGGIAEAA